MVGTVEPAHPADMALHPASTSNPPAAVGTGVGAPSRPGSERLTGPVGAASRRRPVPGGAAPGRDRAIDAFRAFAMFVVVLWHWAFTMPRWRADGPHVDNPISDLPWLAPLTWVLQVVPLFFLVGGHLTARATAPLHTTDERLAWVGRRARRLLGPAVPLLGGLALLWLAALLAGQPSLARAVVLTATPLWFLLAYLAVTALVPLLAPAARRWPVGHVVALVAWCAAWDLARFTGRLGGALLWLSMAWVWLAVHQLGSLLPRVGDRRAAVAMGAAGLAVLVVGTTVGPYPSSMVGTTSDPISNMGPATAVVLGLAAVQLALVALLRAPVGRLADRHAAAVDRLAGLAMPVYVWHLVGFVACLLVAVALGASLPEEPTVGWWLARPLWVVGPALVAWPLVRLAAPGGGRAGRSGAAGR